MLRILLITLLMAPLHAWAHGGGLNSSGCHNQNSNSTYHCHSGPLDGQSFSSQSAAQTALDDLSANKAPTVSIANAIRTVADTDGEAGEVVAISATATDSDGTISSNEWLINNQIVAIGPNANLSLGDGFNSIRFTSTDNDGDSTTATAFITVTAPTTNSKPIVTILLGDRTISDSNDVIGETVSLSATATDSDGTISSTEWILSNQVVAVGTVASLALSDGVNTITFKATDDDGDSSSTSVSITVTSPTPNSSPVVTIAGGDRTISDSDNQAGETTSFSATITDPDGTFLSLELSVNGISSSTMADTTLTLIDGANTVVLKATDNDGGVGTDSVTITVEAPSSGIPDYNRSDYLTNWLDRDSDCVDTRDEVLMIESAVPPTLSSDGCDVLAGLWNDPYTGLSFTNPGDLDVDHLVPLKEAHDSGAYLWSTDRKREFANDLATAHALIAVDLSANRSKGSRDPAAWLPTNTAYHCEYIRNWVDVKDKYGLTYDEAEQAAIESILGKTLTESSRSEILGIRSAAGDSTARFALSMRKNSECGYSAEAQTTDSIKISVSITPEEAQLDKTFDIFLVLSLNSQLLILSATGELIPFTGNIADLIPFVDDVQLKESLEFTLFEGVLAPAINISLFVAYMTSDSEFIFTPNPLSVKIRD